MTDIITESTAESRKAIADQIGQVVTTDHGSLEARKAFNAALSLAQGEFAPIVKNRDVKIDMKSGGSYRFRYADLQEIQSKTRPALASHGLSTTSQMIPAETGVSLVVVLMHAEGFERASEVFITYGEDIKQFGAKCKYMRRYIVTGLLDVDADDDLDENGQDGDGSGNDANLRTRNFDTPAPPPQKPARKTPAAPRAPAAGVMPPEPPPEGDERPPAGNVATPPAEAVAQQQVHADDPSAGAAPAATPPEADTGELAEEGERKYLVKRIKTRGGDVAALLAEMGIKANADTLDGITKVMWKRLLDKA